jgi:putative membrane protein
MRLTTETRHRIDQAIQQVSLKTNAEIALHIEPHSHGYLGYLLIDSFILVGLVVMAVSYVGVIQSMPLLIMVFFGMMLALLAIPQSRFALICFLPKSIKHRHAMKQAGLEYLQILQNTAADKPVILLFVSLAERYIHIMHSRVIHRDVDGQVWKDIVKKFIAAMPKSNLESCCLTAITDIAEPLAIHYPAEKL